MVAATQVIKYLCLNFCLLKIHHLSSWSQAVVCVSAPKKYPLNDYLISFSRPGGDYEFEDYPSPLHIQRHMSRCLLNHNFGSSQSSPQGSSSSKGSRRKSSSSSNSVEILDPIDVVEQQAESRSPPVPSDESIEEILERPGDFQDAFLRYLQEPDFLPQAPTGNEVFYEGTPQVIQVFIEDEPLEPLEPSTSGGRRRNQRPAGRPEACLKRKTNANQPGSSPKKPKIHNIGKSTFSLH